MKAHAADAYVTAGGAARAPDELETRDEAEAGMRNGRGEADLRAQRRDHEGPRVEHGGWSGLPAIRCATGAGQAAFEASERCAERGEQRGAPKQGAERARSERGAYAGTWSCACRLLRIHCTPCMVMRPLSRERVSGEQEGRPSLWDRA